MNRRGFLGALAGIPFVGSRFLKPKKQTLSEMYGVEGIELVTEEKMSAYTKGYVSGKNFVLGKNSSIHAFRRYDLEE